MGEIVFDWDQWNVQKNELKHGVSSLEAESTFYDKDLLVFEDIKHSRSEKRYIAYGYSRYHHHLMIAFTLRVEKIRIISARMASKKEREIYENRA